MINCYRKPRYTLVTHDKTHKLTPIEMLMMGVNNVMDTDNCGVETAINSIARVTGYDKLKLNKMYYVQQAINPTERELSVLYWLMRRNNKLINFKEEDNIKYQYYDYDEEEVFLDDMDEDLEF